jgi:hypothetical protein
MRAVPVPIAYTPSISRVAIETIFATTTSEMVVRPCSLTSSAAARRGAGTALVVVVSTSVLSAFGVLIV